jgi:hypothetical protein
MIKKPGCLEAFLDGLRKKPGCRNERDPPRNRLS